MKRKPTMEETEEHMDSLTPAPASHSVVSRQPSVLRSEAALYRRFVAARLRGQMQYKFSFALQLIGSFTSTGLELVAVFFTFNRFQNIAGWTLGEVALLYALASISFGLHEMVMQSFEDLSLDIQQGTFDRVLLRPVTPFVQVLAADFQLRRLGRVAQGVVAFGVALTHTHIHWTLGKALFLPVTFISGILLFGALDVLGATLCFWTVERTQVINVFTYGGTFMSSYPFSIYQQWLRRTATFVVPLAFVAYYPGLYLLDRTDPLGLPRIVSFATPLVAVAFFALAWRFWEWGVRHYQSTGS